MFGMWEGRLDTPHIEATIRSGMISFRKLVASVDVRALGRFAVL